MKSLLIYSRYEAKRNEFAIKKFKENIDGIELALEEEIDYSIKPDFVINRTNNAEIARKFEAMGVRVFNPCALTELANDKQKCYEFMQAHGVEIMPVNYDRLPMVVKPRDGKGGHEVRLILDGEIPQDVNLVHQKPASDLGRDLRVWLIGGQIIASILRESKTDFRSNFCLGGAALPYQLSDEEKALVMHIAGLVEYDYIGIDFVFNNGKIVFNEIEDSVGARMVYTLTDIDIIKMYCEYINETLYGSLV